MNNKKSIMKKKFIICLVVILILLLGCLGYFIFRKGNEVKIVTLDINPSLQLSIKRDKVIDIVALNNDGEDVITDNIKNSNVNDALNIIVNNLIEKDYIKENEVTVILGLNGVDKGLENSLKKAFESHDVKADVVVPAITEQAKKDAELYNISPAKAAYINEVVEEAKELKFDDLITKSINELNSIKESGLYCDAGYTLVGTNCEKKIREEKPTTGYTCPDNYELINDKCYKTKGTEEEYYCQSGQTLQNNKCTGEVSTNAKAKCTTGEYNSKTGKCEVLTLVGEGTKKCERSEDKLLSNGRCASPHMGAHFDDPEGEIDPATECCCGDTWYPDSSAPNRGWCYNPKGDRDAIISCPSGQTLKDGKCYKAESSDATYYCDGNATLNGNKCTETKTIAASTKKVCSSGYKLYEDRTCVNYSDTIERITGYTCEKDARLENNHCVYYEVVEAKQS